MHGALFTTAVRERIRNFAEYNEMLSQDLYISLQDAHMAVSVRIGSMTKQLEF